jgi:hypothetical protein
MEICGYQLWDSMEKFLKEATKKEEEPQMKVQDQFLMLQQLLETV